MAVPLPQLLLFLLTTLILLTPVYSTLSPPFPRRSMAESSATDYNNSQLVYDFYRSSCPNAETIVFTVMRDTLSSDPRVTAQLLRLFFHDCFIQGCDASLLLQSNDGNRNQSTERDAIPNHTVRGFEVIDRIKDALEQECPNVVSCSDIISLATRDGIILAGGPFYPILTGRRDNQQSYFHEANAQIPRPDGTIEETLLSFSQRGFNEIETVSLLGAHNIGKIGCEIIQQRLSNFKGTGLPDPSIPPHFAVELRNICDSDAAPSPSPSTFRILSESATDLPSSQSLASFVFSGSGFDAHYYKNVITGRGLLYADQQLMADPHTARLVEVFASDDGSIFRREFSKAMLKMSTIGTLVGTQGEVRLRCSLSNSG